MARLEGYYWVRVWDIGPFPTLALTAGQLQVAHWDGGYWRFCGDDTCYSDSSVHSVIELSIVPPSPENPTT